VNSSSLQTRDIISKRKIESSFFVIVSLIDQCQQSGTNLTPHPLKIGTIFLGNGQFAWSCQFPGGKKRRYEVREQHQQWVPRRNYLRNNRILNRLGHSRRAPSTRHSASDRHRDHARSSPRRRDHSRVRGDRGYSSIWH
jgi:hypothetical protein